MNSQSRIALMGGGNMGSSIIGGLIEAGWPANKIWVIDPQESRCVALHRDYAIHTTTDPLVGFHETDILVLAVKPHIIKSALAPLRSQFKQSKRLIISVVAGITTALIAKWTNPEIAIVRAMPNTPGLVHAGATGLFANVNVTDTQKKIAERLFGSIGIYFWVENETQIDAVTALSGSGPAYFLLMIEAMEKAGEKLGLPRDIAEQLAVQTALGAGQMAKASDEHSSQIRERITSPGGTTERALAVLRDRGFDKLIYDAMYAAYEQAGVLSKQHDEE